MQTFLAAAARVMARCNVLWLGWTSLAVYVLLALLSQRFRNTGAPAERPLLAVLGLFSAASLLYLVSLAAAVLQSAQTDDGPSGKRRRPAITFQRLLAFAVLFRLVMLVSVPIQEIDYFRYLWDGRVLWEGGNPYQFSPAEIDVADRDSPAALAEVARLSGASDSIHEIFSRVHHRHVPTIYPPLAQFVFAGCAALTPLDAPLWAHLTVLRLALLGADVLILFVMRGLLRMVGLSDAWTLAYGWCPLAIKETINSAHLDPLAVLWTLIALYLLIRAARRPAGAGNLPAWIAAGAALGLAVLAKSYPVILIPLVFTYALARVRWRALTMLATCVAVVVAGYLPFVEWSAGQRLQPADDRAVAPLPPAGTDAERHSPLTGLGTFLSTWQMNDLLFMIVHENLRRPLRDIDRPFVVVPRTWRAALERDGDAWLERAGLPPGTEPAFALTQAVMGTVLLGLVAWWSWRVYRQAAALALLRGAFLVLAWSWLLASAQNPWYVLWFLPLVPFARCRSWLLIACLPLIYYLRFWMTYRGMVDAQTGECTTFDFGLVWAEHGIVLAALAVESWLRRAGGRAV